LTERDFPDNDAVLKLVRELNKDRRVRINTVAFVPDREDDIQSLANVLRTLADENRGTFRAVFWTELR
jgi:hypothetical protein